MNPRKVYVSVVERDGCDLPFGRRGMSQLMVKDIGPDLLVLANYAKLQWKANIEGEVSGFGIYRDEDSLVPMHVVQATPRFNFDRGNIIRCAAGDLVFTVHLDPPKQC